METYTVLAISTAHILKDDADHLHSISHSHPHALSHPLANMVMARDTGYIVKLYEERHIIDEMMEQEKDLDVEFSPQFHNILQKAHAEGHRMIEFDSDGPIYTEYFNVYNW